MVRLSSGRTCRSPQRYIKRENLEIAKNRQEIPILNKPSIETGYRRNDIPSAFCEQTTPKASISITPKNNIDYISQKDQEITEKLNEIRRQRELRETIVHQNQLVFTQCSENMSQVMILLQELPVTREWDGQAYLDFKYEFIRNLRSCNDAHVGYVYLLRSLSPRIRRQIDIAEEFPLPDRFLAGMKILDQEYITLEVVEAVQADYACLNQKDRELADFICEFEVYLRRLRQIGEFNNISDREMVEEFSRKLDSEYQRIIDVMNCHRFNEVKLELLKYDQSHKRSMRMNGDSHSIDSVEKEGLCRRCLFPGHFARDCNAPVPKDVHNRCKKCGKMGHDSKECWHRNLFCKRCRNPGHLDVICLTNI